MAGNMPAYPDDHKHRVMTICAGLKITFGDQMPASCSCMFRPKIMSIVMNIVCICGDRQIRKYHVRRQSLLGRNDACTAAAMSIDWIRQKETPPAEDGGRVSKSGQSLRIQPENTSIPHLVLLLTPKSNTSAKSPAHGLLRIRPGVIRGVSQGWRSAAEVHTQPPAR